MNSPAYDIALYLASLGFGALGTDIFVDNAPTLPNDRITVFNSGGRTPLPGVDVFRPSVQVLVHGDPKKYDQTYDRIDRIARSLHNVGNMEVEDSASGDGSRYILIQQRGDIIHLPKDENNRFVFSANFEIMRTQIE